MSAAVRRLFPLAAMLAVLALAGIAAAAADSPIPQIDIDPADQAWAESIVPESADLGKGWIANPATEGGSDSDDSSSDSSWCAEGTPNRSDLTATGAAMTPNFERTDNSSLSSYAIVWQTPDHADADWDRTVTRMPAFLDCLAAVFRGGPKAVKIVVTAKGPIAFPTVTSRTAAYRITVAIKTTVRVKKKRRTKLSEFANFDFVLLGNGRASATITLLWFNRKPVSAAYEQSLARTIAARMATDPAASAPTP